MTNHLLTRIAGSLILGLLFGYTCLSESAHSAEQRFKGMPATFWIKQLDEKDQSKKLEALAAVQGLGAHAKEAVPSLVKILNDKEPKVRLAAIKALEAMVPESKNAVPELLKMSKATKAKSERIVINEALGRIGKGNKEVIETLAAELAEKDKGVFLSAIKGLALAGPDGIAIVKDWKKEPRLRQEIPTALGDLGPDGVPALIELVKDDDSAIREKAVQSLSCIGPAAKAVLPFLMEELKAPAHRRTIAAALANMGPDVVPGLMKALEDKDPVVRAGAAQALENLGGEAKPALKLLIRSLKDADKDVRRHAGSALLTIGPDVAPLLLEALKDKDNSEAADVLEKYIRAEGVKARKLLPAITPLLKEDDAEFRLRAAKVLGNFRKYGKPAVPALTEALNDKNLEVSKAARTALGMIGVRVE